MVADGPHGVKLRTSFGVSRPLHEEGGIKLTIERQGRLGLTDRLADQLSPNQRFQNGMPR
jgi:hypothetical protein